MSEVLTVLAVHGLGLDGASFGPLVRELDGVRVHSPDLRGHGARRDDPPVTLAAMTDDIVRELLQMDGPVHLLGHSAGGVVAGLAALAHPEQIASLTIVASPPRGVPAFAERADAAGRDGLAAQVEPTLARWFGPALAAHGPVVSAAERSLLAMTVDGWMSAWRSLAAFAGFDRPDDAVALGARTLCLSTIGDLSTPPTVVALIADAFPGSRHVILDAGGHLGLLDHPSAFASPLVAHWRAWQPPTEGITP